MANKKEINEIINCYPGKVIMHGYQENPYKYISKCDYLVPEKAEWRHKEQTLKKEIYRIRKEEFNW